MKEYTTIQGDNTVEIVIEKSRFIATAIHVDSVEEAQEFIASKRKKYFDATHNCYGYLIGDKAKFSDDGEPQGTAGMPIYECIKNSKIDHVCVVVTRYFGGIKLGAGGLVRAYTQGAVIALKAAQVVIMEPSQRYLCEVAYPLWDRVTHALRTMPVQLVASEFTTAVGFTLLVREKDAEAMLADLTRLTDARFEYLLEDESYEAWDASE